MLSVNGRPNGYLVKRNDGMKYSTFLVKQISKQFERLKIHSPPVTWDSMVRMQEAEQIIGRLLQNEKTT